MSSVVEMRQLVDQTSGARVKKRKYTNLSHDNNIQSNFFYNFHPYSKRKTQQNIVVNPK